MAVRMKRQNQFKVSDKLKTLDIPLTQEQLNLAVTEDVKNNPSSSFSPFTGVRIWIKDFPVLFQVIDDYIRENRKIEDTAKTRVYFYDSPERKEEGKKKVFVDAELKISRNNFNCMHSFILSTIEEYPVISMSGMPGEIVRFKGIKEGEGTFYETPIMTGGMLNYTFSNDPVIQMPERKGFRNTQRKIKDVKNRQVVIFDYDLPQDKLMDLAKSFLSESPEETEETEEQKE